MSNVVKVSPTRIKVREGSRGLWIVPLIWILLGVVRLLSTFSWFPLYDWWAIDPILVFFPFISAFVIIYRIREAKIIDVRAGTFTVMRLEKLSLPHKFPKYKSVYPLDEFDQVRLSWLAVEEGSSEVLFCRVDLLGPGGASQNLLSDVDKDEATADAEMIAAMMGVEYREVEHQASDGGNIYLQP